MTYNKKSIRTNLNMVSYNFLKEESKEKNINMNTIIEGALSLYKLRNNLLRELFYFKQQIKGDKELENILEFYIKLFSLF